MGSPRNRRQRRKRAQKRTEKRRRDRSAARMGLLPEQLRRQPGLPKMSDTLLDFGAPLIDDLADPNSPNQCRAVLMLVAQLWNGLSLLERDDHEAVTLGEETLDQVEDFMTRDLGFSEEDVVEIFDLLAARKEAMFPDETRLIMGVDVERKGDRLSVHAASTFE